MLKALFWDVDGTLAETERDGHLVAYNRAFEELDIPWRWSEERYGTLLMVSGGRERLLHDMQSRSDAPATASARQALAELIHALKNAHYGRIVDSGRIRLRAGVSDLFDDCVRAGLPMAITTTTSRSNVERLLRLHLGYAWESKFVVMICAEEAPSKKPDPQVYEMALAALGLRAHQALTIEDAPAGVVAAQTAGVPVIAVPSHYFPVVDAAGVLAAGPSLGSGEGWHPAADHPESRIGLKQLLHWYKRRGFRK